MASSFRSLAFFLTFPLEELASVCLGLRLGGAFSAAPLVGDGVLFSAVPFEVVSVLSFMTKLPSIKIEYDDLSDR